MNRACPETYEVKAGQGIPPYRVTFAAPLAVRVPIAATGAPAQSLSVPWPVVWRCPSAGRLLTVARKWITVHERHAWKGAGRLQALDAVRLVTTASTDRYPIVMKSASGNGALGQLTK